jgi:hypothetical protein
MTNSRITGIALLVVGAVLLVLAYNGSEAPLDQMTNAFTGRYSDRTMWMGIAGAAAAVSGLLLAAFGRRA